ncbi:MAG TPA: ribonuclease P protein component [Burkholderiales bacterium]|nr:ribonuclease P protein component [Burkholderiales bacterium]
MRRKADFERLLRHGARRSVEGYTFYLNCREDGAPRLGLLVTRKHSPRAVERNRIKRCIREAFRLSQESLGPIDLLVRPPYGLKGSASMVLRLRQLFGKLHP